MNWQALAKCAAQRRSEAILAKVRAAVAEHAPRAEMDLQDNEIRARGRGLKQRWLSEPGLRFARRIGR